MLILVFVFGLAVGSFLNVCISRLPKEESIILPPSNCPACKSKLKFLDLIPILSFVFLKGKCRYCKEPISWRYPVVELLTGVLFVLLVSPFSPLARSPVGFNYLLLTTYYLLLSLLIIVFFTDLEHQVIPDQIIWMGIATALVIRLLESREWIVVSGKLIDGFLGLGLGLGLFYAIRLFGSLIFKREAMGWGDITLAAMLGAFLGWYKFIWGMWLAFVIAAIVSIFLLLFKIKRFGEEIPFGPFMVIGALLSFFFL